MDKHKRDRQRHKSMFGWFRKKGSAGALRGRMEQDLSSVLEHLEVDADTARRLGPRGLQDVSANLWPVDCQTCGRPIGAERPALYIVDLITFASASIHHRACQKPEWGEQIRISGGRHLSWQAKSLLMFGRRRTGERDDRPLMVVNPGLEQVVLHETDEGWRVSTVPAFRALGLRTPRQDFDVDQPVPDAHARIHRANLAVRLEGYSPVWSCAVDRNTQDRIHELGGIILGVTTAALPKDIVRYRDLFSLIDSGKLLFGWVPLEGVEHHQPLRETPAPDALTTYVLHWNDRHATVGELLGTATVLTEQDAESWAASLLFTQSPDWPLEWQKVDHDPAARLMMDPLTASFYYLQQHTSGWKLIKVLSRMDGSGFGTEPQARHWAEKVVRARTKAKVFDWTMVPSTAAGFTTMQGVASFTQ